MVSSVGTLKFQATITLQDETVKALNWWGSLGQDQQYEEWLSFRKRNKDIPYQWWFVSSSNRIWEQWCFRGKPML